MLNMSNQEPEHIEVNEEFFDHINFVHSVFDFAKVDAHIYLNGPLTIPIACNEIVRAKAEEMNIPTTNVGIVFIIEKLDDFLVAMEQFRTLFYSASDLADRIPGDLDSKTRDESSNMIATWIRRFFNKIKSS